MSRVFLLILAVALILSSFTGAAAAEPPGPDASLRFFVGQTVYLVDGEAQYMDAAPVIREGRTLLPIRFVAEPLGASVAWDGVERKVTVTTTDKVIELWIGNAEALVNGLSVPIDSENLGVKPLILQDRTMLPLRFVGENLGAQVEWNEFDRSISVVAGGDGEKSALPEQPRPVIAMFDADPGSIFAGGRTTLSWQVIDATSVTLDGELVEATGSRTVSPATTTTYTLRATGEAGESTVSHETVIVMPSFDPEPPPMTGEIVTAIPKELVGTAFPPAEEPLYVRIMLDSLYCVKQEEGNHFRNPDEPYLVVTGYASHSEPRSWSAGVIGPFSDVDSKENRRIDDGAGRVVFEGEVAPGATVGFNAVVWEADACSDSGTRQEIADTIAAGIESTLSSVSLETLGLPDVLHGFITGAVADAIGRLISTLDCWIYCRIPGGEDDLVANETVTLGYEDLCAWAQGDPHKAMVLDLDGGDSGHYHLRWHLEFDRQGSQSFGAKFTNWDDFAAGDLLGDSGDEIVIVIDEDAPGDDGRFYLYGSGGTLLRTFDAFYTKHDRVAISDVLGGPEGEVIVASNDDGGKITVYDARGLQQRNFRARFTKFDGLAVGNVLGDSKAEILVACDEDRKVYIYDGDGTKVGEFGINWDFDGCRYLDDHGNHYDAFLVGDVLGDGYAEIVMIDNKNGADSKVYVYNANGRELRTPFKLFCTHFDAAVLGDLKGDAKKELLIATDGHDKSKGYAIRMYGIQSGSQVGTRFWPCFTKYDGFAAGDVLGTGKDQVLLATDKDNRVYIGR